MREEPAKYGTGALALAIAEARPDAVVHAVELEPHALACIDDERDVFEDGLDDVPLDALLDEGRFQSALAEVLPAEEFVHIGPGEPFLVEEAEFFQPVTSIHRYLKTLNDVGLGYVRLGQPAPTLSGGEAQRVKLSRELSKRATGQTLYVLDEPSTGLHTADVAKLIEVLQSLVDKGNSVLIIEHNPDIIKVADHIIDLGPEGGDEGGYLIAEGTPEEVAQVVDSHTGRFLADYLEWAQCAD